MPVVVPSRSAVKRPPSRGNRSPIHRSSASTFRPRSEGVMRFNVRTIDSDCQPCRCLPKGRAEEAVLDFDIPAEARAAREQVASFIDEFVLPAEAQIGTRPYFDIVADLQKEARSRGLWCPMMPKDWGGMGL